MHAMLDAGVISHNVTCHVLLPLYERLCELRLTSVKYSQKIVWPLTPHALKDTLLFFYKSFLHYIYFHSNIWK